MVDVVTTAPPRVATTGYVEWGAVIAGAVVASAISFVLLTAGASIGLSLLSPHPSQSYGKLAASLAAFWMLAVPILSLLVGGYIAGRMRTALDGASEDEVEFRDGIQGLLVWAVSIVIGGTLAFLTAASAAQLGADVGKAAVSDRGTIVAAAVDTLLRPTGAEPVATDVPAEAPNATSPSASAAGVGEESRDAITRALAAAVADGSLSAADRSYLARVVSARTGLSPAEAEKRVDDAYAKATNAVEAARKAAVAAGLTTATALLIGLAAAWYAAQRGGQHRDQNIPAKFRLGGPLTRRRSPVPPPS
jgi:hypothetical protein